MKSLTRSGYYLVPVILVGMLIIPGVVFSQYQVFEWFHLEEGGLRKGALPLGRNASQTVRIVDYSKVPPPSPGFRDNYTDTQLGQYGLEFISIPAAAAEDYLTGISSDIVLDRSKLGTKGKALFQADFYLPPGQENLPSLAVLAMKPLLPGEVTPTSLYRLGITRQKAVYFSLIHSQPGLPTISRTDIPMTASLPLGHWHRFAIIFEGERKIHCYVDGQETSFSPVEDSSLQRLQVGILLADRNKSYKAYVDNLSIQWTAENVPLPESPWVHTWKGTAPRQQVNVAASSQSGGRLQWKEPMAGWQEAARTGKPMLVYFYAPTIQACHHLDRILAGNPTAINQLQQYVVSKIDVNQLQGGKYAGKFGIFKVPTLAVLNKNGEVSKRIMVSTRDSWDTIQASLSR